MHWILQSNLFNEAAYEVLLHTLERFELPHSIHKVIPFIGELTPLPELDTNNVICMGSYSMRHSAKKYGWNPGVFDLEPFDFNVQLEHWGERMLNADSVVVPFKDAVVSRPSFLRPIQDSKVFAGKVYDPEDFADWHKKVVVLEEDFGSSLNKNTLIQVCPLKEIYCEFRFWVIKGEIVCASLYKQGSRVYYSSDVPEVYFEYVREAIKEWQPHDAFVIDVCSVPDDIKIVEINTINSSGFYAANIPKLVAAFEDAFSDQ